MNLSEIHTAGGFVARSFEEKEGIVFSPKPSKDARFTDRPPNESICMTCYQTVAAEDSASLPLEKQKHALECSGIIGVPPGDGSASFWWRR
jgi:hypothetical protein